MLTNNSITYYHKTLDNNKLPVWNRFTFSKVWCFGGEGSSINKGYDNANNVNIRIPMEDVTDETIFNRGDIIAIGIQSPIAKQSDLNELEYYNVTSITINRFGENPHVHLGGR